MLIRSPNLPVPHCIPEHTKHLQWQWGDYERMQTSQDRRGVSQVMKFDEDKQGKQQRHYFIELLMHRFIRSPNLPILHCSPEHTQNLQW